MATPRAKRTNEANEPQTSESECESDTQSVELNFLYEYVKFNMLFITSETYQVECRISGFVNKSNLNIIFSYDNSTKERKPLNCFKQVTQPFSPTDNEVNNQVTFW